MTVGGVIEARERSYQRVDSMSRELKECVHEFGEPIVHALLQYGIRDPRRIRHLVHEIWEGARQQRQRREPMGKLDWVLINAGAAISARTLVRVLRDSNYFVVPLHATAQMIEASKAEVANFDLRITKTEKHRRRLNAALAAGLRHIWPDL